MSFISIFSPAWNPIKDQSCIAVSCQVSLVSFNLEQFLNLSLTFLTLAFLKSTSQLFGRVSLNLSLPDVAELHLGKHFGGKKIIEDDVIFFSVFLTRGP